MILDKAVVIGSQVGYTATSKKIPFRGGRPDLDVRAMTAKLRCRRLSVTLFKWPAYPLAPSLWAFVILFGAASGHASFNERGGLILGVNYDSRSASLADIDRDGDLDLFFQGGSGAQQLFRNNVVGTGFMNFTNISSSLPAGLGPSWSAAWADYDGDRQIDVFVGQSNIGATGDVLRNNGPLGFSNESIPTGLNDPGFHQNVAWSDIDNDRDLDLIIAMEGPEKHEIYLQAPTARSLRWEPWSASNRIRASRLTVWRSAMQTETETLTFTCLRAEPTIISAIISMRTNWPKRELWVSLMLPTPTGLNS